MPADQAKPPVLRAETPAANSPIRLIRHRHGAPALQLGLGPDRRPVRGLQQLQRLFDLHCFWAQGRSLPELRRMLRGSSAIATAWRGDSLVGFGRATSDGIYRAVLWDVVVASDEKGQGMGRRLVEALLAAPKVSGCERVYLMTSQSRGFYERLGFEVVNSQDLMRLSGQFDAKISLQPPSEG